MLYDLWCLAHLYVLTINRSGNTQTSLYKINPYLGTQAPLCRFILYTLQMALDVGAADLFFNKWMFYKDYIFQNILCINQFFWTVINHIRIFIIIYAD